MASKYIVEISKILCHIARDVVFLTGPGKTGLIDTKYTCSYYDGIYLLFCMCYPKYHSSEIFRQKIFH